MKRDDFGNIFFIEIPTLDVIDRDRLSRILANRNAGHFALWDLMSQITLKNGINALAYYHQLVHIITPSGVIMDPRAGTVGVGVMDTNDEKQVASANLNAHVESIPTQKTKKKTITPPVVESDEE